MTRRIRGQLSPGAVAVLREARPRVVETLGSLRPSPAGAALRVGHRSEAPSLLPLATTAGGGLVVRESPGGGVEWEAEVPDDVAAAVERGDLAVSPTIRPATIERRAQGAAVHQRLSGPVVEIALMEPSAAAYGPALSVAVVA